MPIIKFYTFLLLLSSVFTVVSAQDRPFDVNLIKFNVLTAPIGTYHISYETTLNSNWSFGISTNIRPKNSFPFRDRIDRYYSDQDITVSGTEISQFSLIPELRYYPAFSSDLRGFYIAYYLQYSRYGISSHVDYIGRGNANTPSKFNFDGTIHTYTLGASVGYQWRLTDRFYLDWQIVGPNFGINKGEIVGLNTNNKPLNEFEQQDIQNKPNEFDIPLAQVKVEASGQQIDVKTKGMIAGVRLGLSIGFKF